MTSAVPVITLSPRDYDAVLFDLDGVLTRSASVHAAAWKKLFDGFLEQRAARAGEAFVPFDIATDYPRYVDGKPRYDGVAAFLASRGIELPLGAAEDGPEVQSVRALGNLKDRYFLQHLEQDGIEPSAAAIALVRTLRAQEIKTAVVSSSNNCAAVLEAAGIAQLFDARVDGTDVTRLDLRIRYRGHSLDLRLTRDALRVRGRDGAAAPISLCIGDKVCEFISGTTRVFRLDDEATVQAEI